MAKKSDTENLTKLGSQNTSYDYVEPKASMLETFENPADREYTITHETMEFTSLCPKTGQPDFATIRIDYIPDKVCVETKSLKLYLFAYRNEGCFMEGIANRIVDDLVNTMLPAWLKLEATFGARGGIQTSCVIEHSGK